MLSLLLPKSYHKFLSLPLLGPITDGFDDWLAAAGFTRGSREFSIRMLPRADVILRRHVDKVAQLSHPVLDDCWKALMKVYPCGAGTVHTLERYLIASALIVDGRKKTPQTPTLSEEYTDHLRQVRGFAVSTISSHRRTTQCFLQHLKESGIAVGRIQAGNIETYISKAGKRLSRASLQHDVAALRGFLRFLTTEGKLPAANTLNLLIDTPRLYRLEQLPRALPRKVVAKLLSSMETATSMGLRDYAMFVLIATYGLRASEVIAIDLDDIRWRQGILRIHQRKTSSPLELPLTNEALSALVKHLKRTPPPAPYRKVFMRMRAPIGVLKPTAVTEAFQALVRSSGLDIRYQGPHCLRHSYALHLLKCGTPLKTIGDILGHRTAESTSMYLRLATGDLREVALVVPGKPAGKDQKR